MSLRCLLLIALSCYSTLTIAQTNSTPPDETLASKMQKLSQAITYLLPYAYSRNAFHDPINHKAIMQGITQTRAVLKSLPAQSKQPIIDRDPLATSSLAQLSADLASAQNAFSGGHGERARAYLQGAIDHCFRCHSRSPLGADYSDTNLTEPQGDNEKGDIAKLPLSLAEQADLYVATRQYNKAMAILRQKITQPQKPFERHGALVQALKKYLAIAVRIKKEPAQGIRIIEAFKQAHHIPMYLQGDLAQWTTSLSDWDTKKAEQVSLKQALALIEKGNTLEASHGFQRGYIEYLRGSALLHELLAQPGSRPEEDAEIYLALGNSYETITALGLWELPEIYYTACINTLPNSGIAQQCYTYLEHNVLLGYTGSAGTHVPLEKLAELQELCQLAGLDAQCFQAP